MHKNMFYGQMHNTGAFIFQNWTSRDDTAILKFTITDP